MFLAPLQSHPLISWSNVLFSYHEGIKTRDNVWSGTELRIHEPSFGDAIESSQDQIFGRTTTVLVRPPNYLLQPCRNSLFDSRSSILPVIIRTRPSFHDHLNQLITFWSIIQIPRRLTYSFLYIRSRELVSGSSTEPEKKTLLSSSLGVN